jgi:hypothetical protein
MTIWIVVNLHIIANNRKTGLAEAPIRVTKGKHGKPRYGSKVRLTGPATLVYNASKPVLPCGAHLAIQTEDPVEILPA